jgi:hypothetical protein
VHAAAAAAAVVHQARNAAGACNTVVYYVSVALRYQLIIPETQRRAYAA